ncbi:chromosomal replication initiator protein DnaA [Alphaproteobacteria bacterium]|nr:chromosomal replication initiator protein DnaA [Alphaproteobacteria bacterium]GHS99080.1 chromosomal replication initiator protein DnaA [Alphaproteobacteria bacterium]
MSGEKVDLSRLWIEILADIAKNIGSGCCQSWFEKALPLRLEDGVFVLQTNQRLVRDRLLTQYHQILLETCQKYIPEVLAIEVLFDTSNPQAQDEGPEEQNSELVPENTGNREKEFLPSKKNDLDPRFTFENFIVGKPNEFAHAAALRVAESQETQFNPLFLYGGVGLGKTHLMHAIAWKIRENYPKRTVIYLSAEKFMYQFIRALRFHNNMAFKDQFRSVDVLMIDDFQFIGGKETTQEEFFHTFNDLVDKKRQVILSADKSPSDLENIGERLKSRLGWGLVADIHPTTYELRLGILQAKAETLKLGIPNEVLEFLSAKITSNVRELEGALNRIMAHASLVGRPITLESTQEVLRDLLRSNEHYLAIEDIQKRTSEFFGIKIADLLSSRRLQTITRPRQVAMYLCKELTTKSLPDIGRKFGGRDHTTVIHAVKKVQELCAKNAEFAHDIETLKLSLIL